MPESVVTNCKKCTDWQVKAFDKIAAWYSEHDPEAWNALINKFMEEAKKLNIQNS